MTFSKPFPGQAGGFPSVCVRPSKARAPRPAFGRSRLLIFFRGAPRGQKLWVMFWSRLNRGTTIIANDIFRKQGQEAGAEHRSEDIALNGYQAGEEQRDARAARSAVVAHESKVGLKHTACHSRSGSPLHPNLQQPGRSCVHKKFNQILLESFERMITCRDLNILDSKRYHINSNIAQQLETWPLILSNHAGSSRRKRSKLLAAGIASGSIASQLCDTWLRSHVRKLCARLLIVKAWRTSLC